jgi:hypothetical protein
MSRGRPWSPRQVKEISFSGVRLGADAVAEYVSPRRGSMPILGIHPESFSPFGHAVHDGIGMIPWARTVYLTKDSIRDDPKDLSFVWKLSDPRPMLGEFVPNATVGRSLDESYRMVVSSVLLPIQKVDPVTVEKSFRKRFGEPTVSYSTSGTCGDAKYLMYGSDPRISNGWSFEHFHRCVAADVSENMPPFDCDPNLAQKSAWFGVKIFRSSMLVSIQDDENGWRMRYSKGYIASFNPRGN